MVEKKVSRRGFLNVAVTAVVVGVIAGVGGYYAGLPGVPTITTTTTQPTTVTTTRPTTVTTTQATTITTTQTRTVGAGETVTTTVTAPGQTSTVTQPPVTRTDTTTVTSTIRPAFPPLLDKPMEEIIEGARQEGNLLLYYSTPASVLQTMMDRFSEKYPFITVEHYRATSGKLAEKFIAEAQAGRFLSDALSFTEPSLQILLSREGLLQQWDHPDKALYPAWASDPDGYYVANSLEYFAALLYNTTQISAEESPKSWTDLLDAKWAGRIGMVDPRVGGGPIAQYYFIKEHFPGWHRAFAQVAKPRIFPSNIPMSAAIVAGEIDLAPSESFAGALRQVGDQAPMGINVYQDKEGTFATQHTISIPKEVPHPNASKLWVDFELNEETSRFIHENMYWMSLREGVGPNPNVKYNPPLKSYTDLTLWDVPWDRLADPALRDELSKEFESTYLT